MTTFTLQVLLDREFHPRLPVLEVDFFTTRDSRGDLSLKTGHATGWRSFKTAAWGRTGQRIWGKKIDSGSMLLILPCQYQFILIFFKYRCICFVRCTRFSVSDWLAVSCNKIMRDGDEGKKEWAGIINEI